jgi:APA family basic amino acid/polyamine antiporter
MKADSNRSSRLIGPFTAICLVVANTIGTGVFTSLGYQVADIQSYFALLALWAIGGIFAMCGALSYAELGSVMPRSGGEYTFLSQIYHPAIGFLSGWISVTVGFAAPIAAAAIALADYLSQVFPIPNETLVAAIVAILISTIHTRNLKTGSSFQDWFTVLKVISIVVLIACGFFLAEPQFVNLLPSAGDIQPIFSPPFAVSLVFVTYAYSGWNASVYIANEIDKPEKNLPFSLIVGTAIVMVLYLLLNFIFLYSTPLQALAGKTQVGAIAAEYIFGDFGGKLMILLISFGLISSISSMIWAGPRVTQAIGEDIPFFQPLAKRNASGIPDLAIWIQLSLILVLLITSSFEALVTYLGFTLTLSSLMTVAGVFVHRYKYPEISRPYRTWGYPITPLIFIGVGLWVLIFTFMGKPVESLAGLFTIFLGLPIYFFAARKKLVSSSDLRSSKQSISKNYDET